VIAPEQEAVWSKQLEQLTKDLLAEAATGNEASELEAMPLDESLFAFPTELQDSALEALTRRPKRAPKYPRATKSNAKRVDLPLFNFDEEVQSDSKTVPKDDATSMLDNVSTK